MPCQDEVECDKAQEIAAAKNRKESSQSDPGPQSSELESAKNTQETENTEPEKASEDSDESEDLDEVSDWEEAQDRKREAGRKAQDEGEVWAFLFGAVAVCIGLSMLLAV
jgi:uncharacterized membrane protein